MNTYEGRKFAVITGGSSGIGYEFAKVCADENFEVAVQHAAQTKPQDLEEE